MNSYQNILLAVDFSDQHQGVVARARLLAQQNQAQLSLIHVVDYMPVSGSEFGEMVPMSFDMTEELLKASRQRLMVLGEELGVPESQQFLEVGSVKSEVVRVASEQGVDLIVTGSHGWSGIEMLLGSTADGILHHAECDVVVIRAKRSD